MTVFYSTCLIICILQVTVPSFYRGSNSRVSKVGESGPQTPDAVVERSNRVRQCSEWGTMSQQQISRLKGNDIMTQPFVNLEC